ncbi:MAG: HEPN domain-containing protein [Desulforudis sp.]|nr:MAG: HEPN domain-containing protein [Desulforudis sp.]
MKRDSLREGQRWFAQAERDLDDTLFALRGKRYNLACFLAQQCAEKALKAYIYAQGASHVWGHSVAELCRDATAFDPAFRALGKNVGPLDKYYIPTRYPNGLPGGIPADAFSLRDAELAYSLAERAVVFVRDKLGSD